MWRGLDGGVRLDTWQLTVPAQGLEKTRIYDVVFPRDREVDSQWWPPDFWQTLRGTVSEDPKLSLIWLERPKLMSSRVEDSFLSWRQEELGVINIAMIREAVWGDDWIRGCGLRDEGNRTDNRALSWLRLNRNRISAPFPPSLSSFFCIVGIIYIESHSLLCWTAAWCVRSVVQ